MFKKIVQNKASDLLKDEGKELCVFFEDIDAKQKNIDTEKTKIKEERADGARITRHRFVV
ncbi:TPA: hypothetical protein NQM91_004750 [Salmonella enterica]|uniref:Uncharacterized protein n=1 Tax=Salmonella enterica subsp. houtenae serovar 45:g,z51:- TaxID=1967611 RepID=A0A736RM48_SALHO|nr:hypothetical protein [Salmonella enterica]ECG1392101.1 hypothetical protein [Salmonella enterica subsp. houtenae str. CFSAN000557]EHC9798462.1 hypothetical protein [Salmonella enterica subsp. enterica serovar Sandiego]HAE7767758.1 hypothetical protein [Salmonella enterica subsp. houtenae serovar 45:g,z51:-]HCJ1013209.1 hypothetical protein [Salmonella enterica]